MCVDLHYPVFGGLPVPLMTALLVCQKSLDFETLHLLNIERKMATAGGFGPANFFYYLVTMVFSFFFKSTTDVESNWLTRMCSKFLDKRPKLLHCGYGRQACGQIRWTIFRDWEE